MEHNRNTDNLRVPAEDFTVFVTFQSSQLQWELILVTLRYGTLQTGRGLLPEILKFGTLDHVLWFYRYVYHTPDLRRVTM